MLWLLFIFGIPGLALIVYGIVAAVETCHWLMSEDPSEWDEIGW